MRNEQKNDALTSNGKSSQTQVDSHLDEIHNYIINKEERNLGVFLLNEIDRTGLNRKQNALYNFVKATLLIELYKENANGEKLLLKSAESLLKEIKTLFRVRPEHMKASYRLAAIRVKLLLATNSLSKTKEITAYINQAAVMMKGAMSMFPNDTEMNELAIELEIFKKQDHGL